MKQLADINSKKGKTVLIGAVFLIWGAIICSIILNGHTQTWKLWHIPATDITFLDFRLIPGAIETFKSGIDPAISNPYDPIGRLFNYPKIWYWLFSLNISQDDTVWISITLIVLFFLVLFAFPEKIYVRDSLLFLVFIFSPACMLLYERGNVDLIIFILLGLTILTVRRWPIVSASILLVTAFLKLFPIFGITAFLQENKKRFYMFFSAISAIFLLYLLLNIESLKASWQLTQRGTHFSYGVYIVFGPPTAYFHYYLLKILQESQVRTILLFVPYLFALVLLAGIFFIAMRVKGIEAFPVTSERNLAAFRLGAAIYIGTFLLGNNWDYRMAFLLFVIPQFSQWLFLSSGKYRWLYLVIFIAMFASCWGPIVYDYGLLIFSKKYESFLYAFDEIMNWSLFLGLTYLLIASAPSWFRSYSWNPFSQEKLPIFLA
jgi:hypothetical protein